MMNVIISFKEFLGACMYWIYYQSPDNKPRKIEAIVEHIREYFVKNDTTKGWLMIWVDENKIQDKVKEILMSCKEFQELNLSQYEYDKGVSVDDDTRPPFAFTSIDMELKPYYDFIDLDACIRNISAMLERIIENEKD